MYIVFPSNMSTLPRLVDSFTRSYACASACVSACVSACASTCQYLLLLWLTNLFICFRNSGCISQHIEIFTFVVWVDFSAGFEQSLNEEI